jgi:pyrimidine operon attenuation protein/uracil phosphoribosyltransferase
MTNNQKIKVMREVSIEWDNLMKLASSIQYGEAKIVFNNGKPIRADFVKKQIKLTGNEEFKLESEIILSE